MASLFPLFYVLSTIVSYKMCTILLQMVAKLTLSQIVQRVVCCGPKVSRWSRGRNKRYGFPRLRTPFARMIYSILCPQGQASLAIKTCENDAVLTSTVGRLFWSDRKVCRLGVLLYISLSPFKSPKLILSSRLTKPVNGWREVFVYKTITVTCGHSGINLRWGKNKLLSVTDVALRCANLVDFFLLSYSFSVL